RHDARRTALLGRRLHGPRREDRRDRLPRRPGAPRAGRSHAARRERRQRPGRRGLTTGPGAAPAAPGVLTMPGTVKPLLGAAFGGGLLTVPGTVKMRVRAAGRAIIRHVRARRD